MYGARILTKHIHIHVYMDLAEYQYEYETLRRISKIYKKKKRKKEQMYHKLS